MRPQVTSETMLASSCQFLESEGEFDNRSEINNRALATIMVIAMRMTI